MSASSAALAPIGAILRREHSLKVGTGGTDLRFTKDGTQYVIRDESSQFTFWRGTNKMGSTPVSKSPKDVVTAFLRAVGLA
ncbi:hypothetical protein [Wenjunlia tyrosinilytica]|uniref:Uncharacterized protein n=1 Tax=Wenjunlia tyrosinilytica TaxID=1544741 RepID=A0A917ZWQ4_9ACTN|nr:hypothetical protein [Wenjunlia tyrosinilytica]GGO98150.1 hypothetical protein GCM10012280_61610 [Wenjunlia tyrosinilytica]